MGWILENINKLLQEVSSNLAYWSTERMTKKYKSSRSDNCGSLPEEAQAFCRTNGIVLIIEMTHNFKINILVSKKAKLGFSMPLFLQLGFHQDQSLVLLGLSLFNQIIS